MKDPEIHCYGLVLTGGGARGAYQAGVLTALAEILPNGPVPFPVLTGVSVGGLNTIGLASHFGDFAISTGLINAFWKSLTTDRVFRTGWWTLGKSTTLYLASALFPFLIKHEHRSVLDTSPLREALSQAFQFGEINRSIRRRGLKAVGLTCSGYASGHAVTFFQATDNVVEWQRARRRGQRCELSIEHAMATAALPLLFEAIRIGDEYFGDGHLRQTSPLAPAIHLGADRILVVATRDETPAPATEKAPQAVYPSLADFGGYGLDTIFHDSLEADIERLRRINNTIAQIPKDKVAATALKTIETLVLAPSRSLREVAKEYQDAMPFSLRWNIGRKQSLSSGGRLESYLLFEPGYINALIDLGYRDTLARKDEVLNFLSMP